MSGMIKISDAHVERIVVATKARVNAVNDMFESAKQLIVKAELPEEYEGELKGFFKNLETSENEVTKIMRDVTNASANLKEQLDKIAKTEVDGAVAQADGAAVKSAVGHLI